VKNWVCTRLEVLSKILDLELRGLSKELKSWYHVLLESKNQPTLHFSLPTECSHPLPPPYKFGFCKHGDFSENTDFTMENIKTPSFSQKKSQNSSPKKSCV
jgi:hypothetical protein